MLHLKIEGRDEGVLDGQGNRTVILCIGIAGARFSLFLVGPD